MIDPLSRYFLTPHLFLQKCQVSEWMQENEDAMHLGEGEQIVPRCLCECQVVEKVQGVAILCVEKQIMLPA